jgi:hypothetical protein
MAHIPKFTGREHPLNLRILAATNFSSPAITAVKRRRKYSTSYPNATLLKDWDIIEQIHASYVEMAIPNSPIQWIRTDHDCWPTAKLSPAAKYIHAVIELLEDETPHLSSTTCDISPQLLREARCLLRIRAKPIYAQYTKHIREAASLPELYGYFRRRYKWTKEILDDIQWPWFKAAVRTYSHNDNHLMKLIYDQLPTRVMRNKTGGQPWLPCTCPHCSIHPETFDHLLQCDHEHSQYQISSRGCQGSHQRVHQTKHPTSFPHHTS